LKSIFLKFKSSSSKFFYFLDRCYAYPGGVLFILSGLLIHNYWYNATNPEGKSLGRIKGIACMINGSLLLGQQLTNYFVKRFHAKTSKKPIVFVKTFVI
jgi:hypothetical protein